MSVVVIYASEDSNNAEDTLSSAKHKALSVLYNRVEQTSSQSSSAFARLSSLDVKNDTLVKDLSPLLADVQKHSDEMLQSIQSFSLGEKTRQPTFRLLSNKIQACSVPTEATLRGLTKLLVSLRSYNVNATAIRKTYTSVNLFHFNSHLSRTLVELESDEVDVEHVVGIVIRIFAY